MAVPAAADRTNDENVVARMIDIPGRLARCLTRQSAFVARMIGIGAGPLAPKMILSWRGAGHNVAGAGDDKSSMR
jgi:hypothetical protein